MKELNLFHISIYELNSRAHSPIICFRASLNVTLEWYITFLTKQWCKALKGGTVSLKKRGPRRLPRYPSLKSMTELAICLIGKAHVTKVKLNFNFSH